MAPLSRIERECWRVLKPWPFWLDMKARYCVSTVILGVCSLHSKYTIPVTLSIVCKYLHHRVIFEPLPAYVYTCISVIGCCSLWPFPPCMCVSCVAVWCSMMKNDVIPPLCVHVNIFVCLERTISKLDFLWPNLLCVIFSLTTFLYMYMYTTCMCLCTSAYYILVHVSIHKGSVGVKYMVMG